MVHLFVFFAADHVSSVVTIQPSIADVQEGQSLELNCHAPGNPPPQVTWTKASGRLSSNHQVITQKCKTCKNGSESLRSSDIKVRSLFVHRVQVLGNQLRILSATPEDSGEYVCRVKGTTGNPGSHVHQASVSVSVTSSSSRKLVMRTHTGGIVTVSAAKYKQSCCFFFILKLNNNKVCFDLCSYLKCSHCT